MRSVHRLSPALPRPTSVFWLVQSRASPWSFLLHSCLFFSPGMWCLIYSFPSLFVRLLDYSLHEWWVPMFPCCMSLLEVAWVVNVSLQACSSVTLEDVAVLGECCPSGRDSLLNLLVLFFLWCCFFSGAVSLFHVDVPFNVLDLSIVDMCQFLHHLCHQLIHLQTMIVAFVS